MAKNESEYAVHLVVNGELQSALPSEDIPAGVKVTNPLVLGKGVEEDGKVVESDDKPRRGRPAKDADES